MPEAILQKPWYVYILKCSYIFLYTGISPDVKKRVLAHKAGRGAKFTKGKYPIELVYIKRYDSRNEAAKAEVKTKRLGKLQKEKMIKEFYETDYKTDPQIMMFLEVNVE